MITYHVAFFYGNSEDKMAPGTEIVRVATPIESVGRIGELESYLKELWGYEFVQVFTWHHLSNTPGFDRLSF